MHGLTAGKYGLDSMASYLAGKGYECITFDFTGHKMGDSDGRLERVEQIVENALTALENLLKATGAEKAILLGHSMGGVAALGVASARPSLAAGVITLCTGWNPERGFRGALGQTMMHQRADYVDGLPIESLLRELDRLTQALCPMPKLPILCVSGRQDILVSEEQVRQLAEHIGPSAETLSLETTHLEAVEKARGAVVHWLDKKKL